MFDVFVRNWWIVTLRGLCSVVFGAATIAWPGATLATLLLLFGAYTLADGIVALIGVFIQAQAGRRWVLALHGLADIAAGLLALGWPGFTALALLYLVAAWAILVGISTILAAIELRKAIDGEWLLGLSGATALLFGVGIAAYPAAATLALLGLIAAYAIIVGAMQIVLGLRLRGIYSTRQQMEHSA